MWNLVEEADHVLDLAVGEHEDVAAFDGRLRAGRPERPGEPDDVVVSARIRLQCEPERREPLLDAGSQGGDRVEAVDAGLRTAIGGRSVAVGGELVWNAAARRSFQAAM